jgi:hypothetical protein
MLIEHQRVERLLTKGIPEQHRKVRKVLDTNFIEIVNKLRMHFQPLLDHGSRRGINPKTHLLMSRDQSSEESHRVLPSVGPI